MTDDVYGMYQVPEEHEAIRAAVAQCLRGQGGPQRRRRRRARASSRRRPTTRCGRPTSTPRTSPSEYGGAGADALATAIVIEEIARVCAASSLIPAVNKLGTMPLLLAGSEELKRRYLTPVAAGEAMFSYCLSEPEAGSDAAAMTDPGRAGRRRLRPQRRQAVDHQRRGVGVLHRVRRHHAGRRGPGHLRVRGREERPGGELRRPGDASSASRARRPARSSSTTCGSAPDRMIGAEGTGFATAMRTLDHTRVTIAAQAVGIGQGALDYALGYVQERHQFGRAVADFQGIQFMLADLGMKLEAARQLTYAAAGRSRARRRRPDLLRGGGQVLRLRHRDADHHRRGAVAGRVRLHQATTRSSG